MGINLKYYYLYKHNKNEFVLLRVNRPGYNNANQNQENQAERILDLKVDLLLKKYLKTIDNQNVSEFIGIFQGLPEGDVLYKKNGTKNLKNLRYAKTNFEDNSIFISIAKNEEDFIEIISDEDFADNGFTKEDLFLPSIKLELTNFITENDYDLTSILDAYTYDLEDKRLGIKN